MVEVILFLENEPVGLERLSKMTSLSEETTRKAITELQEHYREYLHGLDLAESRVPSSSFLPQICTISFVPATADALTDASVVQLWKHYPL